MQRKTVVLVCMVDSIHVARWIAQFYPTEVKFIIFPSGPNRRVHPKILEMIENGKSFDNQIRIVPFDGKLSLPLWALDRLFGYRIRGLLLRRILKKARPDFVHALEFQHAGYVTIRALEDKSITTPFIATNYGSDIYWFQRFASHRKKIQQILELASIYSCECQRDAGLALSMGFRGTVLPIWPNSGLPSDTNPPEFIAPADRHLIISKGYDGWAGRAIVFLKAMAMVAPAFKDETIVLFSCNVKVRIFAKMVSMKTGLAIVAYPKNALSEAEMIRLFSRSRIYVGISVTDGVSTSSLEAMSVGAFPIKSDTSCSSEWFLSGQTGHSFASFDPEALSVLITEYYWNLSLLSDAAESNMRHIQSRRVSMQNSRPHELFYGLGKHGELANGE